MSSISVMSKSLLIALIFVSSAKGDYPPPSEDESGYYIKPGHKPINPGAPFYSSFNSIANFNHDPNKPANRDKGIQGSWHNLSPQVMYGYNALPSLYAPGKCVPIPRRMTLCKDVGYNKMLIPNFLDHYTVSEAVHQSNSWIGVRAASCHKDIRPFLCSLYAPLCIDGQGLRPCRSMCEAVKEACEPSLRRLNYSWPEMFKCDQFPDDDQLCLRTQVDKLCQACKPASTYEQALDLFCQSDFVLKVKVEESVASEEYLRVTVNEKVKILRFVPRNRWTRRFHLTKQTYYVKGGYNCDCPQLETIDGVRDNSSLVFLGKFDSENELPLQNNNKSLKDIHENLPEKVRDSQSSGPSDKLYASSVVVLTKNVRKMLQKVSEVGQSGIEELCKNRPESEAVKENPKMKKPSKDKKAKMNPKQSNKKTALNKTGQHSGTKSRTKSKQEPQGRQSGENDKKRRRGGVVQN